MEENPTPTQLRNTKLQTEEKKGDKNGYNPGVSTTNQVFALRNKQQQKYQ